MAKNRLVFAGHEVWVAVDGKKLITYAIDVKEEEKRVICWIPSEADKAFTIGVHKLESAGFDSAAYVYLDGHRFRVSGGAFEGDVHRRQEYSYAVISSSEVRDFKFASLETTDDDSQLEVFGSLEAENIGEIKVIIQESNFGAVKEFPHFEVPEPTKVHESAKKAMSHQIRLGESKIVNENVKRKVARHLRTAATFVFMYRPLAMLRAQGIAPREPKASPPVIVQEQTTHVPNTAPNPEPSSSSLAPPPTSSRKRALSEVKQEFEEEEDQDSIQKRKKDLLARLASLQAELDEIDGKGASRPKTKVKREPKLYFTPGEIIDLT